MTMLTTDFCDMIRELRGYFFAKDRDVIVQTDRIISGAGSAGVATAQNQMTIADAALDWALLAAPTAQHQTLITGADPYTPIWTVRFDATVPNVIQPDDSAATGSATVAARRDHEHGIVCAAPASPSVNLSASAEGSSTSFARADHAHQLSQAIVPTWTGLHTFDVGITFGGATGVNVVTVPDNVAKAVHLVDAGDKEYLRVVSTNSQPVVVFNEGGSDIDFRVESDSETHALFVRGSDGKIGFWASTLNARVEIGGTPGPAMLNLPTNLSTIDAGLSSRNIADESIVIFGTNVHSSYTGRTVTAEAGACVRCDTRDQDGGTTNKYTIFHVVTRAAGAAESSYTVPFQIAAGAPTGSLVIHRTGDVEIGAKFGVGCTPTFQLEVVANAGDSFAARFFNDGDNINRHGLRVQCGADNGAAAGATEYLLALDGNADWTGEIKTINGVFQLVDASDECRKVNIRDTKLVGLDIIKDLQVRDYNWKANPKGPVMTSFIAQEAQKVYPDMISVSLDGTLGTSRALLIPVLVKAIQELEARLVKGGL